MAIQVIPEQQTPAKEFASNLATGLGSTLGQVAGKGIGAGLGAIGTGLGKMTGLVPQGLTREMLKKAGFKDADIDILLSMDAKSQPMVMNMMIGKYGREEKQPGGYTDEVLKKLGLNQRNRELVLATDPKDQPGMVKYLGERQDVNDIGQEDMGQPQQEMPIGDVIPSEGMGSSAMGQPGAEKSIADTLSTMSPEQPVAKKVFGQTPEQKRREADELRKDEKLRIAKEKLDYQKSADIKKHEDTAHKISQPFKSAAYKEEENSRHMQDTIGEQLRLSKSGKMNNAGFLEFLERFGFDMNYLKNPTTEQYQSLEKEYLKDLKSIFGGKISNDEMKAFLKGIPKATNSPEAREAMLERWNAYYEAKGLKAKLIREIKKENKGKTPIDLEDQVFSRLQDEQERLSKKFLGVPQGAEMVEGPNGQRGYIDKSGKIVVLA